MATRMTSVIYDDLDGSAEEVGTYRFAFNGVQYEIDVSRSNFDRMAATFQPFIAAARRPAEGDGEETDRARQQRRSPRPHCPRPAVVGHALAGAQPARAQTPRADPTGRPRRLQQRPLALRGVYAGRVPGARSRCPGLSPPRIRTT